MMTLAKYRAAIRVLQSAIKQTKDPELKKSWQKDVEKAQEKVRQLEIISN